MTSWLHVTAQHLHAYYMVSYFNYFYADFSKGSSLFGNTFVGVCRELPRLKFWNPKFLAMMMPWIHLRNNASDVYSQHRGFLATQYSCGCCSDHVHVCKIFNSLASWSEAFWQLFSRIIQFLQNSGLGGSTRAASQHMLDSSATLRHTITV